MDKPLRLKIAQYLTAGFPSRIKAIKEDGVIDPDSPDEERAAEAFLREATTAVLFVADQDERRLSADRAQGEYREAVERLVDGVVEDVRACKYPDRASARMGLALATARNEYVTDPALQRAVLDHGTHPSAHHHLSVPRSSLDRLPWQDMAGRCMWLDAVEELERRPEYQTLAGT